MCGKSRTFALGFRTQHLNYTTMKKKQDYFRLFKEQIALTKVLNEAVASIDSHLKSRGKTMWNFLNETNYDNDRIYGFAFVEGLDDMQEVVVCGIRTREVSGQVILDAVLAEKDKEPKFPMTDKMLEEAFTCDNRTLDDERLIRIYDLVFHFDGKMTLLSLILNLDEKYIKL